MGPTPFPYPRPGCRPTSSPCARPSRILTLSRSSSVLPTTDRPPPSPTRRSPPSSLMPRRRHDHRRQGPTSILRPNPACCTAVPLIETPPLALLSCGPSLGTRPGWRVRIPYRRCRGHRRDSVPPLPFGVNSSLAAALASLADAEGVQRAVADIVAERERIVPPARYLSYDIPDRSRTSPAARKRLRPRRRMRPRRPHRASLPRRRARLRGQPREAEYYSVAAEFARTHGISA